MDLLCRWLKNWRLGFSNSENVVYEEPLMMIIMGLGAKSLNRVCIVVVICYLLLTWSDGGLKIFKFKLRISKTVFESTIFQKLDTLALD